MTQLTTTACVLHDLGLAAGFGSSLFGKVALSPALETIWDERERENVVHRAWQKYRFVDAGSLLTIAATWLYGHTKPSGRRYAQALRPLLIMKDLLVVGTVVTGVGSFFAGRMLEKETPDAEAEVPLIAGGRALRRTPERARKIMKTLSLLRSANIVLGAAAIGVTAMLAVTSGTSAPRSIFSQFLP